MRPTVSLPPETPSTDQVTGPSESDSAEVSCTLDPTVSCSGAPPIATVGTGRPTAIATVARGGVRGNAEPLSRTENSSSSVVDEESSGVYVTLPALNQTPGSTFSVPCAG